jgi:hypothetical protein
MMEIEKKVAFRFFESKREEYIKSFKEYLTIVGRKHANPWAIRHEFLNDFNYLYDFEKTSQLFLEWIVSNEKFKIPNSSIIKMRFYKSYADSIISKNII